MHYCEKVLGKKDIPYFFLFYWERGKNMCFNLQKHTNIHVNSKKSEFVQFYQ